MRRLAVLLLASLALLAQDPPSEAEEEHLRQVVGEAGSSPTEFMRALEAHLKKYPNTARRADLERALVKAAMDARDNRRIRLYGEVVLAREPDEPQILERVARALLMSDDKESASRALKYAQALERTGRVNGKALVYQARATGNLGGFEQAAALARRSFEAHPTAESAREIARWLARQEKYEEAVRHLADAFMFPDPVVTDAERAADRARLGEFWRKTHASEAGLGDVILAAYDRAQAVVAERRAKALELDPNSQAALPLEFTLSALDGPPLKLASLQGKVIVLDFWATWCGPCRAQKPLYDQVRKRFQNNPKVVFLAVNTDEDRSLVEPFLKQNKWPRQTYFEDGMGRALRISSIPTTLILGKIGEVFSRMNGFVPDRFVDMLTERVKEALAE